MDNIKCLRIKKILITDISQNTSSKLCILTALHELKKNIHKKQWRSTTHGNNMSTFSFNPS